MSRGAGAPIVVFGDDWGRNVSSMQHVFRQVIGRRPIVWLNAIGHRVPGWKDVGRAWEKAGAMVRSAAEPPDQSGDALRPDVVVQPRVLPWHHLAPVRAFNTRSLQRAIAAGLARLGTREAPVLVTGSPPSAPVVGTIREQASVYFCMDDFLHLPGVTPWMIEPLERELLGKVDALVATAERLTHTKVPASGRVHYLPQGVNYDHFAAPRAMPPELAALPRPLVGFAGGVSDCVEFPLLERVAAAHAHGSVVLVGPVTTALPAFHAPNIHVLGPRPYAELPAYVQQFDVGIIPYLLNEWTMAVDPLKLLEYCAAGIPVVTTDIPEVRKYRNVVTIADGAEKFLAGVRAALAEDRVIARQRGQTLARRNTWADRAAELLRILDELCAERVTTAAARA